MLFDAAFASFIGSSNDKIIWKLENVNKNRVCKWSKTPRNSIQYARFGTCLVLLNSLIHKSPADLWGNGTRTNSIRLLSLGTNIRTWPLACPKRFSDTATFSQRAIFSGGGGATICPLYTLLHDLFTKPVNSEHSSLKIRHQRAGATLETLKSYAQGRRKNRGLFSTRVKQKSS